MFKVPGCGSTEFARKPSGTSPCRKWRTAVAVVTIRQLLDNGVHFGHQTRRWNPKVKRFILAERAGIHIIDLQQSLGLIDEAYDFVKETVAHGGTILFVGTKKQAQEAIAEQATRVGQPYVNQRWLGGLLTNFSTVSKRLARMKELEELDYEGTSSGLTKKELLLRRRELEKLQKTLGGIRNLTRTPSAIWIVDAKKEHLAIDEARKLGIPVVGILDTNCDPDEMAYPIPGNDDAIRSVSLLTRIIGDAVAEGLIKRHQGDNEDAEPLADWERELLEGKSEEAETVADNKAEAPAEKVAEEKPATEEKPVAKKAAAKKAEPAKEAAAKEEAAKETADKKPAAKKPAAKKADAKDSAEADKKTEKPAAKDAPAEKAEKKPAAKKATPKKASEEKAATEDSAEDQAK